MISKVLIANRGEIAVRIIRTCREMGLRTVAVYSDADVDALHVRLADEAHRIGPPPSLESYLNIGALLKVAAASGADAVHPGYGFLAENPMFADAVADAGLTWIGPPAHVIASLGDKLRAKSMAAEVGVQTVPGYAGDDDDDQIARAAQDIGFPVMLKAAAGGGGKGMRVVTSPDDLAGALESARREATAAFGDGRVFLEKLLSKPRHIEVQILVDVHGAVVHLGERDCSIQRRHQKVVEESPSPVMNDALRAQMGEAAVRLARAAGYVNAGTVEFLYADEQFYFLEVNTRIQVEHPVTEIVTGLDLVRLQIQIASGERIPFEQADVVMRGHAIEARIYAEDPDNGFVPSTGRLRTFQVPDVPGVRNDVGADRGAVVTPYYDPMLAKLISYGDTRGAALAALEAGLAAYRVEGVTTNLSFLQWVIRSPAFREGQFDITFLDTRWEAPSLHDLPDEVLVLAAVAEYEGAGIDPQTVYDPWRTRRGWREFGATRTYRYVSGERPGTVQLTAGPGTRLSVLVGERPREVWITYASPQTVELRVDGERVVGQVDLGSVVSVEWQGDRYELQHVVPRASTEAGRAGAGSLSAPMPGTVVKVLVEPGQRVDAHEPLMVLEAMKMEHVIEAPYAAVVEDVLFARGDLVSAGALVVCLESL